MLALVDESSFPNGPTKVPKGFLSSDGQLIHGFGDVPRQWQRPNYTSTHKMIYISTRSNHGSLKGLLS